jgi:aspartyl/asparaginyl beta-hydroxylase (cupin superfamily)
MDAENQEEFPFADFSIKELKEDLDETNLSLLEDIRNRYMQSLLASMVFFIFNQLCKMMKDQDLEFAKEQTNDSLQDVFFKEWERQTKKIAKKELLQINEKLQSDIKMNFLSAISNFSLPSTEDYQSLYNKALLDVQRMFEKNTKQ